MVADEIYFNAEVLQLVAACVAGRCSLVILQISWANYCE